jgi:hypothetical protein
MGSGTGFSGFGRWSRRFGGFGHRAGRLFLRDICLREDERTGPTSVEPVGVARRAGQSSTMVFPLAVLAALNTAVVSELNFGPCIACTPG